MKLIVVNYSLKHVKAHVKIPNFDFGTSDWKFNDILNYKNYVYNGKDLNKNGIYIELDPWDSHIFEIN